MKLILKSGLLAAMVFALVGTSTAQAAIFSGPLPLSGCLAGKAKCVIKMKSCQLGCYNKSVGKGLPVDTACLDKCRTGFLADPATGKGCIEKLDAKNAACGASLGDAAVLRSKIEAHVLDLVGQLNPAGTPPVGGNKCGAGKNKCVSKYNACVLGIVGKAFKAGTPVGALDKCNALLTNNYLGNGKDSCVGKLEVKYGPACLTLDDQGLLKAADDAFVNDIIYDLVNGQQNAATKRCTGDTSVQCSVTADCAVPGGTCEFFFGSPLPLAAGGVATCVTNQWNGAISGTFDQQTGASAGTASVIAKVYTGGTIDNPCPVCSGANEKPNDGVAGGTCSAGLHSGAACDANGESPVPSFGSTSLDCPPSLGGLVATLPVDLTNVNTGTVTATLSAASPTCSGSPGDKCLCASCSEDPQKPCKSDADCTGTCTNPAGEPRKPNACVDNTLTPGDETICAPLPGGEGECTGGPVVSHCKIEIFRGCILNSDCPAAGDECASTNRECYPGYNGAVGDTITAVSAHGAPHNHTGTSTFASIFCVAPTGSAAVNSAAGLPGPGRLTLGGVSSEDGTDGACPSIATFLPTAKGGVLDTGWNGLGHDAKVVGQGMVTVGVTGCANLTPPCGVCSYTGPVANP